MYMQNKFLMLFFLIIEIGGCDKEEINPWSGTSDGGLSYYKNL
jgi:hypothetical protein